MYTDKAFLRACASILLLFILMIPKFANCATEYVCPPGGSCDTSGDPQAPVFTTIQDAVNQATAGTTIIVRPGIYTEPVQAISAGTSDLPISLIANPGAILDGGGTLDT